MQRALVLIIVSGMAAGCGGGGAGKIMADTPVLPYVAPDISEITGIEEPDEAEPSEPKAAEPAPAPAPAKK